jgi:magnesium chelatase subunit D
VVGGLDLPATLAMGRPVLQRGLLAECDGGVVVAAMAERLPAGTAAQLAQVLDDGVLRLEREGLSALQPARLALIALDEAGADDTPLAPALADRLAIWLPLDGVRLAVAIDAVSSPSPGQASAALQAARQRLPQVRLPDALAEALVGSAMALGVDSSRAAWWACRVARAAAAAAGRDDVTADDAQLAVQLVLAPRATRLPPAAPDHDEATPPGPPDGPSANAADDDPAVAPPPNQETEPLQDRLLDAARAAIPAGLLAQLLHGDAPRSGVRRDGAAGALSASKTLGRPLGARRGKPAQGSRLHLLATLRAAAPWQVLRQRAWAQRAANDVLPAPRIHVRADDFHIQRRAQKRATTTLFVVDASGSAALHRLAEAKGAVELLLAECYVRRDEVAVLAFRGRAAELLLPPTRSLVRARRALAGLPGGGGTPLAAGIVAATQLARQVRSSGASPLMVLLTDGRANVSLGGEGGRAQAAEDALAAARHLRALGTPVLLVDTAVRPEPAAVALALAMGARYLALPHADASVLGAAVIAAQGGR